MLLPFAESPHDLSAEDRQALEEHLAQCPECGATISRERAFHGRVSQAMLAVPVPDSLRAQLHTALAIDRSRVWRRKIIQVTAAAAAVLLIAFAGWTWWNRPQSVDLGSLAQLEEQQVGASPEMVNIFFESKGARMDWPPDFDPNLLRDEKMVDFKGRQVPQLIFQRGEGMAKVYVLRKSQFKMAKGGPRNWVGSKNCTLEVIEGPDYLFVVVYIGDVSRQHFQNQSQQVG
jgi:hypothetical protein